MPDQRDKTKAPFTFYIDRDVKENAKEILAKRGSTLTEYLVIAIYKLIEKNDNEILEITEILQTLKERDTRTKAGKARITARKKQEK